MTASIILGGRVSRRHTVLQWRAFNGLSKRVISTWIITSHVCTTLLPTQFFTTYISSLFSLNLSKRNFCFYFILLLLAIRDSYKQLHLEKYSGGKAREISEFQKMWKRKTSNRQATLVHKPSTPIFVIGGTLVDDRGNIYVTRREKERREKRKRKERKERRERIEKEKRREANAAHEMSPGMDGHIVSSRVRFDGYRVLVCQRRWWEELICFAWLIIRGSSSVRLVLLRKYQWWFWSWSLYISYSRLLIRFLFSPHHDIQKYGSKTCNFFLSKAICTLPCKVLGCSISVLCSSILMKNFIFSLDRS